MIFDQVIWIFWHDLDQLPADGGQLLLQAADQRRRGRAPAAEAALEAAADTAELGEARSHCERGAEGKVCTRIYLSASIDQALPNVSWAALLVVAAILRHKHSDYCVYLLTVIRMRICSTSVPCSSVVTLYTL